MAEPKLHPDSMLFVMASLDGNTPVETLLGTIHLERSEAGTHLSGLHEIVAFLHFKQTLKKPPLDPAHTFILSPKQTVDVVSWWSLQVPQQLSHHSLIKHFSLEHSFNQTL